VVKSIFGNKFGELTAGSGASVNVSPASATKTANSAIPVEAPVSVKNVGFRPGADGGTRVEVGIAGGTATAQVKVVNGMVHVTVDQIPAGASAAIKTAGMTEEHVRSEVAKAAQTLNLELARKGLKFVDVSEKNGFLHVETGPRN
jgi:hypothetical protein